MAGREKPDGAISDVDLIRRHLAGESEAFAALVKRYRNELFNFLVRFTGNMEMAEDVFQEAFLQLHISAGFFDQSRPLKPWLFTIAANKARDAMRGQSRRQAVSLDATVYAGNERTSYADLMPSDVPGPQEFILNLDTSLAVQNIISEMPENLRIVLLLCYFHEMPYKEIAEALNAPLGTIKSRIHAAVKLFAQKWKAAATRLGRERNETG